MAEEQRTTNRFINRTENASINAPRPSARTPQMTPSNFKGPTNEKAVGYLERHKFLCPKLDP